MAVSATYRIEAKLSDTVDQFFDEEIADFDAVTPTWDKEVDEVLDFDAEVDGDGDLNDSTDAAHDGDVGLEITFDDANAAYGVMDADAVDQTSGVISFWIDPNDLAIEAGKVMVLAQAQDGAASNNWSLYLYPDNTIACYYKEDGGGSVSVGTCAALTDYSKITVMFKRSTGAGNNDGFVYFYVEDALIASVTDADNDTKDWDKLNA